VRPSLEFLEDRLTPSTFTVVTTADNGDDVNPIPGSLRAALVAANAHDNSLNPGGAADVIAFAIPGTGPQTIAPTALLPQIYDPVVLDGYTQPGASANTNGPGLADNAVLQIELAGTWAELQLTADNSTISGLAINRVAPGVGACIAVYGSGNLILGNFLGTDIAGAAGFAGQEATYGVVLQGPFHNVVQDNVISGNSVAGVLVDSGSAANLIANNHIGTSAAGDAVLGNGDYGVFLLGAGADNMLQDNVIRGGTAADVSLTDNVSASISGGSAVSYSLAAGSLVEFSRYDFLAGTTFSGAGTARTTPSDPCRVLGDMTITGVSWEIGGQLIPVDPCNVLLTGGATFSVLAGGVLQPTDPCNVLVSAGSSFSVLAGGVFQPGDPCNVLLNATATFTVGGTLIVNSPLTVTGGSTFIQTTGLLTGSSTLIGDVINAGTVAPGNSPGTLTINGNYTQTGTGRLEIEVGGTAAGQYDRLIVTGTANLGGTLNTTLVNGFTPAPGDSFPVLQYTGSTGSFAQVTGALTGTPGSGGLTLVPSSSLGKVTGGGSIAGPRTFAFEISGDLKNGAVVFAGNLEYHDNQAGIDLKATSITGLTITGSHAVVTGTAKVGDRTCSFTLTLDDNGEPGVGVDDFRLVLTGGVVYDSGIYGTLLDGGNVQVKQK
jgi:hypothetical protein